MPSADIKQTPPAAQAPMLPERPEHNENEPIRPRGGCPCLITVVRFLLLLFDVLTDTSTRSLEDGYAVLVAAECESLKAAMRYPGRRHSKGATGSDDSLAWLACNINIVGNSWGNTCVVLIALVDCATRLETQEFPPRLEPGFPA